jgi:hypothetical protein
MEELYYTVYRIVAVLSQAPYRSVLPGADLPIIASGAGALTVLLL